MVVHHRVAAERLSKNYFRRWRKLLLSTRSLAWRLLRGRFRDAFEYELYL